MPVSLPPPQISVIVPTYECDRYLAQAIDSVLSQTECTYELIIIDDGSTDQTREVVETYRNQLSGTSVVNRFQYYFQDNQGVCVARNHGLKLAQGDFVAFLDADDFFLPGKLAAQVNVFDTQPELGIVHSGWQRVSAEGNVLMEVCPWETVPDLTLETWLRFKPVLPSAMMFRRHWLEQVSGFDPKFTVAEDVDLVLRLALEGCTASWLPQVTVGYRQREHSAMRNALPQAHALTQLLDAFFKQPQLPANIKLIEQQVRYSTLVWVAWDLYYTGQLKEMTNYLQKSLNYSPYLPIETIIHWVESFAEFSSQWGENLDIESLTSRPEWQQLTQRVVALLVKYGD